MPAPISLNSGACSMTCDGTPLRDSASAAPRPPIPPPTISTGGVFVLLMVVSGSRLTRGGAGGAHAHFHAADMLNRGRHHIPSMDRANAFRRAGQQHVPRHQRIIG